MQGDTQSFVVRIWQEAVDGAGNTVAWRGSIDHVNSAKRLYFQDWDRFVHFIQEESGVNDRWSSPGGTESPTLKQVA
jgi:hypothetical protein